MQPCVYRPAAFTDLEQTGFCLVQTRECSSYRIECRGIFVHKKQKMAVIPMLRVENRVLLPNALKRLASSIVVLEKISSEISNL